MGRKGTSTFIVERPLRVSVADEREALVRLDLARQLKNATLAEALRRLDLMRQSRAWAKARAMPRMVGKKTNKARQDAFNAARHAYGFTSASLSSFASDCKNKSGWNTGRRRTDPRIGAHECQRIAEQVFVSVEAYSFGARGRPRFRGKGRPLHSIEGKSAGSGLAWNAGTGCLEWGELRLTAMMPPEDRDAWLSEALWARTKYARVVWRVVKGKRRWFVQLAQEGVTPQKHVFVEGVVGLDVGPSAVAVVGKSAAALCRLAPDVDQPWKAVRSIQRAMDRSRRATNPECFNADGTYRRRTKIKVRSSRYLDRRAELAEIERVLEKRRDRSHGRLANHVIGMGNVIHAEKLSYVSFQKGFGRSTKVRAAGSLMSKLRCKAERAGGELIEIDTWSLKLSQYDHPTDACTKKPLNQRWHVLGDGSGVVQRDLYSAFLARCVDTQGIKDALHSSHVVKAWPAAQSLLGRAGWMRDQPVNVAGLLATAPPELALPTPERVARRRVLASGDAADVVGVKPRAAESSCIRT